MSREQVARRDYLGIVEAAYAPGSQTEWLQRIAEAARPVIDVGPGTLVYTYDASDPSSVRVGAFAQAGGAHSLEREARDFSTTISAEQARLFYCASPPTELVRRIFRAAPAGDRSLKVLRGGSTVVMDAIGIRGHNPDGRGCVISGPSLGPYPLSPRARASLDRVALHLAAAFRLRAGGPGVEVQTQPDAVFSAKGKLEHLDGEATTEPAALLTAVENRLLGRRIRREQPERALELWRALISGRWSIVDHVDTDGKRFIVARRNDVSLESPTGLQRNERFVVLYAAWGHSNKLIAYELGLAPSTVSTLLHRALRKLRLRSRADLVRLFASSDVP